MSDVEVTLQETRKSKDILDVLNAALSKSGSPIIKALHTKKRPMVTSAKYGHGQPYQLTRIPAISQSGKFYFIPVMVLGQISFRGSLTKALEEIPEEAKTAFSQALLEECTKVSEGEQWASRDPLFQAFSRLMKQEINSCLKASGQAELAWDVTYTNGAGVDAHAFVLFDFDEHFLSEDRAQAIEARNQVRKANRLAARAQVDRRQPVTS